MAQKYKLVMKKNLGKDADKTPRKLYAIPKYNGYTDMALLCKLISARSTASSADVKAVLDSLLFVLDLELQAGRIVNVAELGNFRLSLSSTGTETKKDFSQSKLKGARIIFTPGEALRNTVVTTSFSAYTPETVAPEEGGGEDDRPGEL